MGKLSEHEAATASRFPPVILLVRNVTISALSGYMCCYNSCPQTTSVAYALLKIEHNMSSLFSVSLQYFFRHLILLPKNDILYVGFSERASCLLITSFFFFYHVYLGLREAKGDVGLTVMSHFYVKPLDLYSIPLLFLVSLNFKEGT